MLLANPGSVATARLGSAPAQLHVATRKSGSGSEAHNHSHGSNWLSSVQKQLSCGLWEKVDIFGNHQHDEKCQPRNWHLMAGLCCSVPHIMYFKPGDKSNCIRVAPGPLRLLGSLNPQLSTCIPLMPLAALLRAFSRFRRASRSARRLHTATVAVGSEALRTARRRSLLGVCDMSESNSGAGSTLGHQ